MRNVFAFGLVLILGLAPMHSFALEDGSGPKPPPKPVETDPVKRLDNLFADLKRERNEKTAERIAGRIWNEWNHSRSASTDLMMQWSQKAIENKKYDTALDFPAQFVVLPPDYAEGWNRRATVHFMMNNYRKSMADIDKTLQLEPRHFGALSGMAQIMKNTDHKELALSAYQRVLDIYPMMRSAQNEVAELSEELAGEGI
mgnify:CR=1 FL=1